MLYLLTLLAITLPSVLFGFYRGYWKIMVAVAVFGMVFGYVWDFVATNIWCLWSFNPQTLVGVWFLGLPLEELLFTPLVAMSISVVTLEIHKFLNKHAL